MQWPGGPFCPSHFQTLAAPPRAPVVGHRDVDSCTDTVVKFRGPTARPAAAERGSGHFNSWNKAGHRDSCCRVLLLCGGGFSEAENYLIRCYE